MQSEMKRVAVVILNWNGEEMLRRFLPAVCDSLHELKGDYAAEVVVADNGSTDGSCRYLREHFSKVRLLELDQNYGFAEGYNRALKEVEAEYYILLNSDVEVPKDWINPLVDRLQEEPTVAAVMPKILSYRDAGEHFEYAGASGGFIDFLGYPFCRGRILRTVEEDHGQYDDPREIFWASGAAFCCRADLFHRMGGFSSHFFAHMEEIDLCWRLQLQGWRIEVLPKSRVWHVGGATLAVDSPKKIYLNHRNNLMMLYRCASPWQRVVVALVRPFTDLAAALSYLLKGHGAAAKAVAKAWWDFLAAHPRLKRERQQIRKNVEKEPFGIYRGSIILRYLFGGRRFNDLI